MNKKSSETKANEGGGEEEEDRQIGENQSPTSSSNGNTPEKERIEGIPAEDIVSTTVHDIKVKIVTLTTGVEILVYDPIILSGTSFEIVRTNDIVFAPPENQQ